MRSCTRFLRELRAVAQARGDARRSRGRGAARLRRGGPGGRALGLALALSVAGAALAPVPAQDIRVVDLLANDLVYDPVSERIYASVPSAAGLELGNSITVINPFTGKIESSVFVGSEPGELAVSDDGQFVYVGLNGASIVRRYNIAAATAGLEVVLGSHTAKGPLFAEDVEVLPGAARSIAVSRRINIRASPRHVNVAVYDDDVMRPNTTSQFNLINRIEFSASASLLYGYNNETTEFGLRQISITADGAQEIAVQRDLIWGFFEDIEYEQGVLYATTGAAVDPDALTLLGTYAATGLVEADAALGKVFFFDGEILQIFDLATFIPEDFIPIAGVSGLVGSLVRWGSDGLAFRTSGGLVFLISQLPPAPRSLDCAVELNQSVFVDGDAVVANSLRLTNPTSRTISVEGKLWFDRPDKPPVARRGILPTGRIDLLPGDSREFGPVTLGTVSAALARGPYAFNCRLLDPVTARHRALDKTPFELR